MIRKIYSNQVNSKIYKASIEAREAISEINKYLFSTNKKLLVTINNGLKEKMEEGFFSRQEKTANNPNPLLFSVNKKQVAESYRLCLGGLGFNTPKHASGVVKAFKYLSSIDSGKDENTLVRIPSVDEEKRYEAARKLALDISYYPDYILPVVEDYLLPKLLNNIDKSIVLCSFSLGGREIIMIENAMGDILRHTIKDTKLSKAQDIVSEIMSNVNTVCLGYAPQINHMQKEGFNKMAIFSLQDRAVLIPQDYHREILTKPKVLEDAYTVIDVSNNNSKSFSRIMVLNPPILDNSNAKDYGHHTLKHYLCDIDTLLPEELKSILFNTCDLSIHQNVSEELLGVEDFE